MKKKIMSVFAVLILMSTAFAGCSTSTPAASAGSNSTTGASSSLSSTVEPQATPKEQTIVFWYHDGNPTSNPIFEAQIKKFEEQNPGSKVEYVGLPSDSYLQKYNTAIATNTVPDVAGIRDMDTSAFVNQDALMALDDSLATFDQAGDITEAALNAVRSAAIDKKLYVLPQYVTMDIAWANTALMQEKGVEPPKTIDEFIKDCEKYADATNGKYFYSLRGGAGSMENLFDFMFTYANQTSLFDAEGNCVINGDKFVEALDLYASIYWNGWTTKDSVTNGFKEMVAEFGSQTSMYMSHNSSSLAEHKKNLGQGNFANILAPANSEGITVTKDLSFVGYGVFNEAKNKEGGIQFAEYLVSGEAASYHCQAEGRIPVNKLVYEESWYKEDPYMQLYRNILESPNVRFLTHAIWLPQWNEFRSKLQEPGLQAVLMKEKTSKEVLDSWAEYLTTAQKEYLQSK